MTDLNQIIDSLKLIYDLLIDCVDEMATLISISEEEKGDGKKQFRVRENVPGVRVPISKKKRSHNNGESEIRSEIPLPTLWVPVYRGSAKRNSANNKTLSE